MTSFSLVGALEFRHLVNSLQPHASATSLSLFDSPVTPYAGGHYHTRRSSSRTPLTHPREGSERDPWDAALAESTGSLRLEHRPSSPLLTRNGSAVLPPAAPDGSDRAVPALSEEPAQMSPAGDLEARGKTEGPALSKPQRVRRALRATCHVLFPTLLEFRAKSAVGKFMALFAAPAVLLLTLTLPVVVSPHAMEPLPMGRTPSVSVEGQLMDFEEEGYERALIAEEEVQEELHGIGFNKWLMAAQCVFGPLFVVSVLCG
jgi:solute carrier family 24 (sodium/potassium/calcium exchanger), member 6